MYSTYFTILTDPSGLTCKLIILSKFSKIDQSKQMLFQIPIFMGLKHTSPPQILLTFRVQILDLLRQQRGKKVMQCDHCDHNDSKIWSLYSTSNGQKPR